MTQKSSKQILEISKKWVVTRQSKGSPKANKTSCNQILFEMEAKKWHCISSNFCSTTKNTHIVLLGFSTHHSAMARLSLLFTLLIRCHGDGGVAVCDDCLTVSGAGRSSVDGIYQKATPNAAHSWIDTSDLDIFWNYPPPRMPVTTRIVILLYIFSRGIPINIHLWMLLGGG